MAEIQPFSMFGQSLIKNAAGDGGGVIKNLCVPL
jgi:hypothetical protein